VIPVTNEWGAAGSGGERGFLAPSSHSINGEVILVSSPLESSCILSVWQGSAEVESEDEAKGTGSCAKGALKLSMEHMQPPQASLIYPHVIIGPLKMST